MILKPDCRHFQGDRPCTFHKETGVHCPDCAEYQPIGTRILIIKLDAVGDVLRTTSILPGLHSAYPNAEITWVTLHNSLEIFKHNPYVHRVMAYEAYDTTVRLSVEQFDVVINLDSASKSAALATFAKGAKKIGYGLNEKGKVFCFNPEAETWFVMGAFDDIKKKNTKTYQQLMLEICGLQPSDFEIVLRLSVEEQQKAKEFRSALRLQPSALVIGMNTGASERWEQKKWTLEGYRSLIQTIMKETPHVVVLYGGKQERERNEELQALNPQRIVIAQTESSLRDFFALMNAADIILTGDTLALHVATALQKRVIAVFGPTSAVEIESYGRVRKVLSDSMECKCYYRPVCTEQVNCMNTISPEQMFSILQEEIWHVKQG